MSEPSITHDSERLYLEALLAGLFPHLFLAPFLHLIMLIKSTALALSLGLFGTASAAILNIADLYNTGVDNSGIPQGDNAVDLHYTFVGVPPTGTVPIVATAANGFPIGPWMGDNGTSAWISPAADTQGNAGNYTYRTTFTVPAGVDATQAFVRGRWTSDNAGVDILINGVSTGITQGGNFGGLADPVFGISKGLINGTNTIDFVVNEASGSATGFGGGGYTGLRVEMSGGYAAAGRVGISSLVNSGALTSEGAPLGDNAVVTNITLAPGSAQVGSVLVASAAGGFPIGPWIGDDLRDSTWVTPAADTNILEGDYFYQINFDMTGLDPNSVEILGRWAVDNAGVDILLNGVSTGNSNGNGFGGWTDFDIASASGDAFLPGINTLTFVAHNDPASLNPGGVRWEFLSATAVPVPEPTSALLLLSGLMLSRRRR